MIWITRIGAVLVGLLAGVSVVHGQGSVHVRLAGSAGEGVPAATVRLMTLPDSALVQLGESDAAGRVVFGDVPAGRYVIVVERIGYVRAQREVSASGAGVVRVDVALREDVVDLPGVLVDAERRRTRFEENVGSTVSELTQRDLKLLPGLGEADVLRAVEVLPGVVSTSDFSSAFNVRGGAADQNLILLDGIPIYNPFHLGGLFSVFNTDMVARAELMAGGFPAQYGGRVSSVLSIDSDPGGPGLSVDAGVSVLATRVAVGTDVSGRLLERVGLNSGRARLSVRRSYFDQLLKPFFDFPYHLTDVQAFGEAWTRGGGRVTFTGYTGRDVLDLAGLEDFPLRVRWDWGNDVAGVGWARPVAPGQLVQVQAGHARFATGIRFPEFGDTEFRSRIDQTLLRAQLTSALRTGEVVNGVAIDRLGYDNLAATGGTVFREGRGAGWLLAAHTQAKLDRGGWQAEVGLRIDAWLTADADAVVVPAPRVAVRRFISGRDVAVRVAGGRYTQFAQSLRDEELPIGIDIWVLAGTRAPHIVSDQIQGGIEGYLHHDWFTSLETYYRRFAGVLTNNPADDPNDPTDDMLRGTGDSYGIDLHVRRERGRLRPMLAVSWLKALREFPDMLTGTDPAPLTRYAPVFDRRLDVDLVLQAALPRAVEFGLRWNYGTGLPYTRPLGAYIYYDYSLRTGVRRPGAPGTDDEQPAVVLGPRNAERYPAYNRVDVGVRRTFRRNWGSYTPYLDVLNVLNRRNVLFYFYQYGDAPPTRSGLSMFPVLPTAGLEVRF